MNTKIQTGSIKLELESKLESLLVTVGAGIVLGIIGGSLLRVLWVNLIFHFGKTLEGKSAKRNVDTVLSMCLMPEAFKLVSLVISYISVDKIESASISFSITIISFVLSASLLIHGLSRVQQFGYVIAVVNIAVPQLILSIIYYAIRGI